MPAARPGHSDTSCNLKRFLKVPETIVESMMRTAGAAGHLAGGAGAAASGHVGGGRRGVAGPAAARRRRRRRLLGGRPQGGVPRRRPQVSPRQEPSWCASCMCLLY